MTWFSLGFQLRNLSNFFIGDFFPLEYDIWVWFSIMVFVYLTLELLINELSYRFTIVIFITYFMFSSNHAFNMNLIYHCDWILLYMFYMKISDNSKTVWQNKVVSKFLVWMNKPEWSQEQINNFKPNRWVHWSTQYCLY